MCSSDLLSGYLPALLSVIGDLAMGPSSAHLSARFFICLDPHLPICLPAPLSVIGDLAMKSPSAVFLFSRPSVHLSLSI